MKHELSPYYKLFIEEREVAIGKLEDLRFMARQSKLPYVIFAYYPSFMDAPEDRPLSIVNMRKAYEMRAKGVSTHVIAAKIGVGPKYLQKVFTNNNSILNTNT